jgi:hypothetical protein
MAVPNAKTCYYRPGSSWVYAFILMCDGSMAVWFYKEGHTVRGVRFHGPPGVCCWYPGTPEAWFEAAIVSASAGKFVHHFLYKKRAYKIIRPPCPPKGCTSPCCAPALIPDTLTATVVPATCSAAACSISLVYNSTSSKWEGTGALGTTGHNVTFKWYCSGNKDSLVHMDVLWPDSCQSGSTFLSAASGNCSPFSWTMSPFDIKAACGCSPEDTSAQVVITE